MGCTKIQYANDTTQIITYPGKSRQLMVNRTVDEIEKINAYERKWKIKTNKNMFKIVPLAIKKKHNIVIDGTQLDFSSHGKVLGLKKGRTGYGKHIKELADKSDHAK